MEKALALNRHEWRKVRPAAFKGFSLLYLGDEFCGQLLPELADFKRAAGIFPGRTILLTPLLTDPEIDAIERIIRDCSSPKNRIEIVVNDLGLLDLIRERYAGRVRVTLGRIFGHWIKVMPPVFARKFIKTNGVARIDIDDPSLPGRFSHFPGLKLSFRSPFRYLSATRFCPWERHWPGPCAASCQGRMTQIRHSRLPQTLLLKGSAYGIRNAVIPAHPMIDRVVMEKLPPRGKQ